MLTHYHNLLKPVEDYRVRLLPGTLALPIVIKGLLDLEIEIEADVAQVGPRCACTPPSIELVRVKTVLVRLYNPYHRIYIRSHTSRPALFLKHTFERALVLLFVRLQGIITILKTHYAPVYLEATLSKSFRRSPILIIPNFPSNIWVWSLNLMHRIPLKDIFSQIRSHLLVTLALALDLGINLDLILSSIEPNIFLDAHIDLLHLIKIDLPLELQLKH